MESFIMYQHQSIIPLMLYRQKEYPNDPNAVKTASLMKFNLSVKKIKITGKEDFDILVELYGMIDDCSRRVASSYMGDYISDYTIIKDMYLFTEKMENYLKSIQVIDIIEQRKQSNIVYDKVVEIYKEFFTNYV